ncbi:MAG: sterol desaturase family protein [Acidimicrobiales bacterium]
MALAIIGVGLVMQPTGWMAIVFLFVLVVPFEKLFPRHRGQKVRRPGLSTDLAFALATPALEVVGATVAVVVGLASLAWLPGLALRPLVAMLPPAILPFVGIALFDLLIYWVHRWSHEVPLLWRFHAIHHSTETLDWVSGLRNHPFDGALLAPAFAFLLAAGFSAEFSGALVAVQIVTGIFLHANVRWKWRPLQRLVITPEFHHWHHANEPEAINTNFSVFLPLWDQIFGTYRVPKDRRPTVYGVDEYVPEGLWAQLRHPFRGMRPIRSYLRHPIRTIEELWAMTRTIVRGMRSSMFAKRRTSSRLNDRAAVPTLE